MEAPPPNRDPRVPGWVLLLVGLCAQTLAESRDQEVIPVERDFMVRSWRKEHGLPDNRVLSLLVSRDGFVWAGTRAGVVRFDGQRFEVWSRSAHAGFTNDTARALAEDPSGRLWVGTGTGVFEIGEKVEPWGLRSPRGEARFQPPDSAQNVRALLVGRRGILYAALETELYARSPDGSWQNLTQTVPGLDRTLYTSLAETSDGSLFIGTARQLHRWDQGASGAMHQLPAVADSETQFTHALAVATDGHLYALIGSYTRGLGSLHRLEAGGWKQVFDASLNNFSNPLFLAPAARGGVWFCNGGLRISRWRDGQVTTYSLAGVLGTSSPLCLAEAPGGEVWIGTTLGGLVCLQPRPVGHLGHREGLPHENTWALLEASDGAFWVGTDGGLARFHDGQVETLDATSGLANQRVRALAEDAGGRVWIGTGAGLYIWDKAALAGLKFEGEWYRTKIRALCRDRDGAMWVGTAQGLHRVQDGNRQSWFPADGLPVEDVRAILEDRQGAIWVGTHGGGLARYSGGRFEPFGAAEGLSSQRVWALLEDANGWLWIGTDRGLNCLRDGRIVALTTAEGLPDNLVNALVEDGLGHFWIGHDGGVYRVRREDLVAVVEGRSRVVRCTAYDEDDGFLNREVNGQISQPAMVRRRDGGIAVATVAGVALLDPQRPPDATNAPPVRIERLSAGGRVLYGGAPGARPEAPEVPPVRIAPAERYPIEVGFTAPHFRATEKTRFRYRLLGLDPAWMDGETSRRVSFAHLRPGRYTFEVVAANHHGYLSAQPARLSFRLEPRLIERAGVQIGAGLLVVGLAAAVGLWRLREVQRIQRLELETGLAQERHRLARDLHDGLGASLTEIGLLTSPDGGAWYRSGTASNRSEALFRSSQEALNSLRELIWTTNPQADHLEALVAHLCDHAQRLLANAGLACRLELPPTIPAVAVGPGLRRQVMLATQEALNNALRHARAREVVIRISLVERTLRIQIVDDGIGFEPGRALAAASGGGRGLGLQSMRSRIQALGGTCEIDSQTGRGCTVSFTLSLT